MDYSNLPPDLRDEFIVRGMPPDADGAVACEWVKAKLPGLARLWDFVDSIHTESDRGCVICATSFIDDALECSIRAFLQGLSNASKSILDALLKKQPLPPIGSFAVRTKMARALGLIDDTIVAALDGMRPMRNDAAHLAKPFSFENADYNIQALFEPLSKKEQIYLRAMHLVREEQPDRCPPMRRLFQIASMSIYYRLNNISENPSLYATAFKVGGHLRHTGPFDVLYDDLMRQPGPESGSSDDSKSTEQT